MKQFRFYDKPVFARGRNVVGIDIGKNKHSAAAVSAQGELLARLNHFSNDKAGIDKLEEHVLKAAGGAQNVLFALEATGHYWMALHSELERRGYRGVVLNPLQTHGEFRTRIRKTKNDLKDAQSIARFILTGKAKAARICNPHITEMRVMVRQRLRLMHMKGDLERAAQSLTGRMFPEYERCFSKPLLTSVRAVIRGVGLIPTEIVRREEEVREILHRASRGRLREEKIDLFIELARTSIGDRAGNKVLNDQVIAMLDMIENYELKIVELDEEFERRIKKIDSPLLSLGIRASLCAAIHAESDPISDFKKPRQYAAYAGLDPSTSDSGEMTSRGLRISKRGSPTLRNALYLSAFSIYRKHDYFHKAYWRRRKKGQNHSKALVSVAHKLALVVWRLLTDNRKFKKRPPKKRE